MKTLAAATAVLFVLSGCEFLPPSLTAALPPAEQLPETQDTYLDLGRRLLEQGEVDLAHHAFIRSIRVEGVTAEALSGAGVAMERKGLLTEARRYFEHAVRVAPRSPIAHNNLGAVEYRIGAYHEARQAFLVALRLSGGENAVAQQNLRLTEHALRLAEADGLALGPNPVPLQRVGSGEYSIGKPGGWEEQE